jgi:TetR/AcrR family transcriptional regulator, transcriptional repressor for nem operon
MSKGDETRQQIVKQAATIFNQRGYTGSSISDVMESTGLKKGGIYRHFQSKEELALAAFDFAQQQSTQCLETAVQAESDAVKQLLAFVHAFQQVTLKPPVPGGCPILNTIVDSDDGDPALRMKVRAVVTRWETLLQGIVQAGIAAGSIRPTIEAQAVAALIISTMEGAILLARAHSNSIYVQYAVNHLTHYLEHEVAAA